MAEVQEVVQLGIKPIRRIMISTMILSWLWLIDYEKSKYVVHILL